MKNTEKAAIPMSPMPKVVFMPRRLSGNRSKQPRSDPSRESSRPTHPTNRIRGFLRIPYFDAAKRFTPTVVFATHRRCRDSDSIALRTAAASHLLYQIVVVGSSLDGHRIADSHVSRQAHLGEAVA